MDDTTTKYKKSFQTEKENEAIKNKIIRDFKNLFELENEKQKNQKSVRVSNFWNNVYSDQETMVVELRLHRLNNIYQIILKTYHK